MDSPDLFALVYERYLYVTRMRLINTSTLQLEDFLGDEVPSYAILSHTWTKEEVTLQEWQKSKWATRSKAGYKKVRAACAVAKAQNHKWLWADAVCIDKTSSADLSEAINSMYAWYRESAECFAYLVDVDTRVRVGNQVQADVTKSRWFTRGWTVQELLAPSHLTFYDKQWKRLGTKEHYSEAIEAKTGIDSEFMVLYDDERHGIPVFQRMTWFAGRKTTRIEDVAYCMLGVFDINMPLLYGEGRKAFMRLQHEILRKQNDHTIFAWVNSRPFLTRRVLATSSEAFADFRDLMVANLQNFWSRKAPYHMTNIGISIRLPLLRTARDLIGFLEVKACGIDEEVPGVDPRGLCVMESQLAIVLQGGDRDNFSESPRILSRALNPTRPLHICYKLPPPLSIDVFLEVESHGLSPFELEATKPGFGMNCESRYGLFLIFKHDSNPSPPLWISSHPSFCLSIPHSLLVFPAYDETWIEKTADIGDVTFRARTTAVILCITEGGWSNCIANVSGVCIMFMLSTVVEEKAGEVTDKAVLFAIAVESPRFRDRLDSLHGNKQSYSFNSIDNKTCPMASVDTSTLCESHDDFWNKRRDSHPMKVLEEETEQYLKESVLLDNWESHRFCPKVFMLRWDAAMRGIQGLRTSVWLAYPTTQGPRRVIELL